MLVIFSLERGKVPCKLEVKNGDSLFFLTNFVVPTTKSDSIIDSDTLWLCFGENLHYG